MPDSERNVPLSHREDKPGCSCIPAFFLEAESISGRTSSKKAVAEYRIREFGREEMLGSRLRSSLLRFYDNGMFLTPKDTRKAGTSSCWRDSGLHWTTLGSKFFEWWRARSLTPIRSPNKNTSANPVYSTSYHTSKPFSLPDSERNLILYIFPKQRTDVGSIPD